MIEKSTTDKASALRRLSYGCLLLAFACLPGGTAWAQGPAPTLIQAPQVYSGGVNALYAIPNAVAVGDFNGDGYLDFAVVEYNSNVPSGGQVEIYLGNPDGSFTAGNIYSIGAISGQPSATNHNIAVGHFNGPLQPVGIAVAVTQAPGCPSGGVVLLYGPGDGTFPNTGCLVNSPGVISVAVADFNDDTYDDIAVSNASGAAAGSITVYFNNGTINTGTPPNSFYNYGSYSSVLPGVGGATVYGTLVAGNLPGRGSNGPSLAMLSNGGAFTQYVSIFENILAGPNGNPLATVFYPSYQPLTISGNGLTDIAWTNLPVQGPTSLVGIGSVGSAGGLQAIPITYPVGIGPSLGPLTPVANNLPGIAMVAADFDGNGTPDFAYLDSNQNLNISLNPGTTTSSNIGPFGPKGQAVAAQRSPGLGGKWVVVDAGIDQPLNPLLTPYNAARSVAVYLVDPTTGKPEIAPLYAPPSGFNSVANGGQPAFAVADFNGVGVPDVAVLGQDPDFSSSLYATVSIFQNAYKTATPGYATPPTVIDLGTLLGAGSGAFGTGAQGYALVAGSFRAFDPDIALVTSQGITLLENQGANTQGPFNFTLAPNCQGYFGGPATPPNNCYLGNDPNYPGISFLSNSPRPAIIAVDVNGDGYQDVVVAYPENCNANSNPNSAIYVFLSNGDGTFQTPMYILSPVVNPVGLAAGKLLGSGFPDLVVVDGGEICSGTQAVTGSPLVGVALIPNIGGALSGPAAKNLFPQPSGKISPNISAVAVADMNGDGSPDVVISATDGLHVLLNSPLSPGEFIDQGAVPLYGTADIITNAAQIDIADLNKDGKLDVAAAIGGIVYIFPGDGKGGLSTPVQAFAAGPDSNQVRAIDVNGDGTADVVVNNSLGFSVLLNGSSIGSGNPIAQFGSIDLEYGGLAQGTSENMFFLLTNSGGAPLTVSSTAYANNPGNQFSTQQVQCGSTLNPPYPITIAPGGFCTFTVHFAPTALGAVSAQLIFFDNTSVSNAPTLPATGAGNFKQSITLNGAGIDGQANVSINISVSPTPVLVGTLGMFYTIKLTNSGPDAATNLTFMHQLDPSVLYETSSTTQGTCNAQQTLGALISCNIGTLPASSSATILLQVNPTLATTLTNDFSITEDETNSNPETVQDNVIVVTSQTVTIPTINENISVSDAPSFTEIPVTENLMVSDQVTVTPLIGVKGVAAVNLSPVGMGFSNTSGTQALTISNVGAAPLTLQSGMISGSAFNVLGVLCSDGTTSLPSSLPSGGACTLSINYNGALGATGTLTFTDSAALSNALQGTQINPTTFTQIVPLNASGTNTTAPPPSARVTIPTVSENISVSDAPSFTDIPVSENLIVSDQVTVTPLIGVNGVAAVDLSPVGLGFSNTSGTQTLTISNVGAATLTLQSGVISGSAFNILGVLCSHGSTSLPPSLPSGGACMLSINYNGAPGATGTLTFTDSAALSNALQGAQINSTTFTQIVPFERFRR